MKTPIQLLRELAGLQTPSLYIGWIVFNLYLSNNNSFFLVFKMILFSVNLGQDRSYWAKSSFLFKSSFLSWLGRKLTFLPHLPNREPYIGDSGGSFLEWQTWEVELGRGRRSSAMWLQLRPQSIQGALDLGELLEAVQIESKGRTFVFPHELVNGSSLGEGVTLEEGGYLWGPQLWVIGSSSSKKLRDRCASLEVGINTECYKCIL